MLPHPIKYYGAVYFAYYKDGQKTYENLKGKEFCDVAKTEWYIIGVYIYGKLYPICDETKGQFYISLVTNGPIFMLQISLNVYFTRSKPTRPHPRDASPDQRPSQRTRYQK